MKNKKQSWHNLKIFFQNKPSYFFCNNNFLYIDDLIKIVKCFINNKSQKNVYNVCTGNVNDFKTLAEKIIKISGKNLDVIIKTERLGREYSGDNSLLLNELKGFEFGLIDESIKALYKWYDLNKHIIEKDKL